MQSRTLAWIALAVFAVAGCEDTAKTDGGSPPGENVTPDTGPPPPNVVTYKKAGESTEADFTGGTEEYLVVPYSVSTTAATAISFDIKLQGSSAADGGLSSSSFKLRPAPLRLRDPALWARWQRRLAVERWTRGLAEKAAQAKMTAPARMDRKLAACSLSSECSATEVCHEGQCASTVTIKVSTFSTATQTIDAKVAKRGTVAAILVDSGDTVAQANVDAMLDKFEKLLYPRDAALFGNPPLKTGEALLLASDRNADGLVWLVFTSKVQEKQAVGFFVATDFDDTDAKSNKADILYLDSGLTKLEHAYSTIAHEFQHLLGFASKVYKAKVNGGGGQLEALWLDEGMSHFAEDACGYGGENVTLLDQEVFTAFSDTAMVSTDDSQAMRGLALTFVRYIFEQKGGVSYGSDGSITDKGGAAMLAKFHTSTKAGTAEVDEVFGSFTDAFDGWILAS